MGDPAFPIMDGIWYAIRTVLFLLLVTVIGFGFLLYLGVALLLYSPPCGGSTNPGSLILTVPGALLFVWGGGWILKGARSILIRGEWGSREKTILSSDPAVQLYIRDAEAYGMPKQEIIANLKSQGWSESEIALAYSHREKI